MRGREATAVGELTGCPPSTPMQTACPVRGSSSRSSAYSSPPACSYSAPQPSRVPGGSVEHLTATEGLRNVHIPGPSRALSTISSGSRHDACPTCAMDSAPSGARYRPLTRAPPPRERAVIPITASSRSRARPLRAPETALARPDPAAKRCLPPNQPTGRERGGWGDCGGVRSPCAAVAPVWLVIVRVPVDVLAPPGFVSAARHRAAARSAVPRWEFNSLMESQTRAKPARTSGIAPPCRDSETSDLQDLRGYDLAPATP